MREEYRVLLRERPSFVPAFPSATNPVLRPPLRASGRVWMEDEEAARTVDLANACYALMLRLLAYSYNLPRPAEERALVCPTCQGRMMLLALVPEPRSIARYLAALGEPTDVPARSPSRGPPYWRNTVLRQKALGDVA